MIISCPHCFIDVSPAPDGTCPACRKNTQVIDPTKAHLLPAEFIDGERLPELCFVCGKPSSGHIECGLRKERRLTLGRDLWPRFLGALGGLIAGPSDPTPAKKFVLSVELPVCREHLDLAPIEPLYVDRKSFRLLFPVHKDLHAAWSKPQR